MRARLLFLLLLLTVPLATVAHEIQPRTLDKAGFPDGKGPADNAAFALTAAEHDNMIFGLAAGANSRASTQSLSASSQINCNNEGIIPVAGNAGSVTLISNPQILTPADLPITKRCIIEGTSDTNTVTLVNGNGLFLPGGDVVLGNQDAVELFYNGTDWIGITGSDGGGGGITDATPSQGLIKTGTTLGLMDCAPNELLKRNVSDTEWQCGTDTSGSGGTPNILDLGDDGSNESSDLVEIATTGDTNGIFTEPLANKLLIAVSNAWPLSTDVSRILQTATALTVDDTTPSIGLTGWAFKTASATVVTNFVDADGDHSDFTVPRYIMVFIEHTGAGLACDDTGPIVCDVSGQDWTAVAGDHYGCLFSPDSDLWSCTVSRPTLPQTLGLNNAFDIDRNITGANSLANAQCTGNGTWQWCEYVDGSNIGRRRFTNTAKDTFATPALYAESGNDLSFINQNNTECWNIDSVTGAYTPSSSGTCVPNIVTLAAPQTLTSKSIDCDDASNQCTTKSFAIIDAAICPDGTTAGLNWEKTGDGATAPIATCNDVGNIQRPTADFSGSAVNSIERTFKLPADLTGAIDIALRYVHTAASPTGNVEWDISTACAGVGENWNASFNAVQTITDAAGSQNALNGASLANVTITGCTAGDDITLKISRDGVNDTNNDTAKLTQVEIAVRRTQ